MQIIEESLDRPITDPTAKQLKTCRGIIYGIRNRTTGMFYVGQSKRTFNQRYSEPWWREPVNTVFGAAVQKYGREGFEVWLFETGVTDPHRLDELEALYATAYNAYHPHGYNIFPCGFEGRDLAKTLFADAVRKHHSKGWKVKEIVSGFVWEPMSLSQFCEERGLLTCNMRRMLNSGRGATYRGFCSV